MLAYSFDEGAGTVIPDASGNGNAGTIIGATRVPEGRYGSALSFDGVDDLVQAGTGASIAGLGPASWTLWVKRAAAGAGALLYKSDNNGDEGWWVDLRSADIGFAGVFSTSNLRRYTAAVPPAGTWFHLAVTWDGGSSAAAAKAYLNGQEVAYTTSRSGVGTRASDATRPLWIGSGGGGSNVKFKGLIDNLRIYNRVLSAQEIQQDLQTPINASVPPPPPPPDLTPPTVILTSPSPSAIISGSVEVAADAVDAGGVAGVQFLLNGQPLGAEDLQAPYKVAWDTATVLNGSQTLSAVARDAAGNSAIASAVPVTVLNIDPRAQTGAWSAPMDWPLVAVHATLLPTGELLLWDAWEPHAHARLWNPSTQVFVDVENEAGIFCSAHTLMADGRVLVSGGHPGGHDETADDASTGIPDAFLFDALTRSWQRIASMRFPRWYPTDIPLSDGRVLSLSGQIVRGKWANTPEIYDPASERWSVLPMVDTADLRTPEYHRAHLLPSGLVCVINPTDGQVRLLDVAAQRWTSAGVSPVPLGSTVMYRPGKILMTGGGDRSQSNNARTTAMLIDMTQPSPTWRATTAMQEARYAHNLVMLPDGSVLAVGGSITLDQDSIVGTAIPERWDPATEIWTPLAPMRDLRMYHSTTLLLPDGRVLAAGGGRLGSANNYLTAEIFSPPYLFKGLRPVILGAPSTLQYREPFIVQTPDASRIASVALIPLGSVTHTINMTQRYVALAFTAGVGLLTVDGPSGPTAVPPGRYLLFLVDAGGVPSIASAVQVPVPAPSGPPSLEAFQETGGQVVMEAEHYDAKAPRDEHDWVVEVAKSGFSRTAYLTALPNDNSTTNTGYASLSPELVYNVWFSTPGTYYVWVRGLADGGNDDSVHAGLDSAGPTSADRIGSFTGTAWRWQRNTMDGAPAALVILSAGLHTIHVWMREDGLRVDKLLLRKSSSSTAPSGSGPAESPRVTVPAP